MFWYSFGTGRGRGGGGCLFLPFLFIFGSFFMFGGFRGNWIFPLLLMLALGFAFFVLSNRRQEYEQAGEKAKHDFEDEKPKRDPQYLYRDNGEVMEVVDPAEDESRRMSDEE